MEQRFDPSQESQTRAIESVTDLLAGQPRIEIEPSLALGAGPAVFPKVLDLTVPNRLDLDDTALLANLQSVQQRNDLSPDPALLCIEGSIETVEGSKQTRFQNFSVEMGTGTGKTYVYLRTALELYRRYGMRKFIVVVPSVAIRDGVLEAMRMTERHLLDLYRNPPYRYYVYDSRAPSQVRQFALSDGIEIMVMTVDSFSRASNIFTQNTDCLQGETPLNLVQAVRPILILDEPQNMQSERRLRALSVLDPLFALRYSAAHRNPYNVVYRLTP